MAKFDRDYVRQELGRHWNVSGIGALEYFDYVTTSGTFLDAAAGIKSLLEKTIISDGISVREVVGVPSSSQLAQVIAVSEEIENFLNEKGDEEVGLAAEVRDFFIKRLSREREAKFEKIKSRPLGFFAKAKLKKQEGECALCDFKEMFSSVRVNIHFLPEKIELSNFLPVGETVYHLTTGIEFGNGSKITPYRIKSHYVHNGSVRHDAYSETAGHSPMPLHFKLDDDGRVCEVSFGDCSSPGGKMFTELASAKRAEAEYWDMVENKLKSYRAREVLNAVS
jgi:hypothetical protein